MDRSAVLRPIIEAAEEIRRLDAYQTQDELAAAIQSVVGAIGRTLRFRLRNDASAPEEDRVAALSPDALSLDDVVRSLRTRDLISLQAAGTVHEARAAARRAETGRPRAADADAVRAAVEAVRREFGDPASTDPAGPEPVAAPEAAGPSAADGADERSDTSPHTGRWMAWVAAAVAALVVVAAAWVVVRGGNAEQEDAVRVFRAGRYDSAAAAFERLLGDRPEDVTLMLYLGRTYRRLGRRAEAAQVLRRAVEVDAQDGGVRRELGHLFVDLERPASAAAQYERAVEYAPNDPLNWAALIRALQALEDPRAEQLMRDAPPDVRAALQGR